MKPHIWNTVQSLSGVRHFATPWTAACRLLCPSLSQIHVHWVDDAIQPSYPLSHPSPPALNLSQHQGLFQWVSSWYHLAKVLELQRQHQSFSGYPGLISSRMDWLDLLAVQGTLKSLLQHHNLKASSLHGPTLKSIHDYWKNHSFEYTNLCWQSDGSAFEYTV